MKNISDFQDEMGMTGHFRPEKPDELEFGDGALRLGQEVLATGDRQKLAKIIRFLIPLEGEPVRYWKPNSWPGLPGSMSRDNLTGILAALAAQGFSDICYQIITSLAKRGGRCWNTKEIWDDKPKPFPWITVDWAGPLTFSLALKGVFHHARPAWAKFIIELLDIWAIPNSLLQCAFLFFWRGDMTAEQVWITWLEGCRQAGDSWSSRRARSLFWRFCPISVNRGAEVLWDIIPSGPQSVFDVYFGRPIDPPIDQLWAENVFPVWESLEKKPA